MIKVKLYIIISCFMFLYGYNVVNILFIFLEVVGYWGVWGILSFFYRGVGLMWLGIILLVMFFYI